MMALPVHYSSYFLILGLALPLSAHAADDGLFDSHFAKIQNGTPCYARTYDAAHLQDHPNQKVRRIEFDMTDKNANGNANTADNFELGFGVMSVTSSDWYTGSAICKTAGAVVDCFLEGDGGRFRLSAEKNGALKLETGDYGLAFEGAKDTLELPAEDKDDKVFILSPAPHAECEAATADMKTPDE